MAPNELKLVKGLRQAGLVPKRTSVFCLEVGLLEFGSLVRAHISG